MLSLTPLESPSTLPKPQIIDIVPTLHALLSRLLSNPPNSTGTPSISLKELVTEAAAIKINVGKAKAAVETLPEVDRTIEVQEGDIRDLEEKLQQQRDVLRRVTNAGWLVEKL